MAFSNLAPRPYGSTSEIISLPDGATTLITITLSITTLRIMWRIAPQTTEHFFAAILNCIMLRVVMQTFALLSVIMLSVITLNVVGLNVVKLSVVVLFQIFLR